MRAYSFGLLQLLCELLCSLGVFLSHLLYLGLMGPVLILDGSLQQVHLLLTFGPGWMDHARVCQFYKYITFIFCKMYLTHKFLICNNFIKSL